SSCKIVTLLIFYNNFIFCIYDCKIKQKTEVDELGKAGKGLKMPSDYQQNPCQKKGTVVFF
ncbi:MAG: hypothetical protein KAJ55_13570, partial [Anaerolineales bacterium]|nr:hypothetical protein [Anaerolineales bacterium]